MQGEAMTTQAARNTSFHLLVVMSSSENTTGQVFLDNGVDMEMGAPGGKWTLVNFSAQLGEKSMTITSSVVNGDFAISQNWVVENITVLGLTTGVKMDNSPVETPRTGVRRRGDGFVLGSRTNDNDQFVVTELTNLNLPIGKDFKLDLQFQ